MSCPKERTTVLKFNKTLTFRIMKTLNDLFELLAQTPVKKHSLSPDWFIDYSGHVNKLTIQYYFAGWSGDDNCERCNVKLTEDGIQEAYWFVKNRLNK